MASICCRCSEFEIQLIIQPGRASVIGLTNHGDAVQYPAHNHAGTQSQNHRRQKRNLIVYYGSDYAGGWQSLDVPLRTVTTIDRFGLVMWLDGVPYLRMLQPSELLRAMGGGTEHQLPYGSRREKIKLCGNGVCSEVMTAIFKWIGAH